MQPLLVLLAITVAATAPLEAAGANSCWFETHFVVPSAHECATTCNDLLNSKKGGSIWPETYTKGSNLCCKCQYHSIAVQGDPSPSDNADPTSPEDASPPASPAASSRQANQAGTTKTGKAWWKILLGVGILALITLFTAAALLWDCCKCRRRTQAKVEEARMEYRDTKAVAIGKRDKKSTSGGLSRDAQRKMAALDLARELRETKLEAGQPQMARFDVVVTTGPASAPSSPSTRSRFQKTSGPVNPFV